MNIYITESLCGTTETNTTLTQLYFNFEKTEKKRKNTCFKNCLSMSEIFRVCGVVLGELILFKQIISLVWGRV